jgi:antitoxin CcdA
MGVEGRKATNLTLDATLVAEAKELGVSLSRAAEDGLRAAVRKAKEEAWLLENAEALRSNNEWVEKNGLPLAKYRMF